MMRRVIPLVLAVAAAACAADARDDADRAGKLPDGAEAVSLLGEPLRAPELDPAIRAQLERNLAEAQAAYGAAPDDADAIIWLGRRTAYLGRYRDAIAIFSEGIQKHPDDARLYRHRGHRWITVRELDRAIEDLTRAAELTRGRPDQIEPDGAPNRFNIPRTTLQSNIWYHLGLAHYLKGDFEKALEAFRECMNVSINDDMIVAAADWLYMTLRRLGRTEEAARLLDSIDPEMEILENEAYHRRLLMYKGLIPPDSLLAGTGDPVATVTQGYGVGNWHLYNGDTARAERIFRDVVAAGEWAAFGHIAAEAELSRM